MTQVKSIAYREVESAAREYGEKLTASDFGADMALVIHEDGSVFMIDSAIIQHIECKTTGSTWIAVHAEHHPTMIFPKDDLIGAKLMVVKTWVL